MDLSVLTPVNTDGPHSDDFLVSLSLLLLARCCLPSFASISVLFQFVLGRLETCQCDTLL